MAFWGIEVKPGKPFTHRFDSEQGRLHLSQATLGSGSSTKKSILQCNVGDKKPIYLCSLLPDRVETCPLNLEFEEEDEVIFSVLGPHSIHLSGFFLGESDDSIRDDDGSDSYGEDIAETESDESTDYDTEDEFNGNFIVDDMDMYPPSPVPNSGVVIEEILDDDKPANKNGISKHEKKKNQLGASDNDISERQLIVKRKTGDHILESEDEDGFPIASNHNNKADASIVKEKSNEVKDKRNGVEVKKKKAKDDHVSLRSLKRKVDVMVEETEQKRESGQQPDSPPANTVVPETDLKQKKESRKKKARNNEEKTGDADTGSKNNKNSEGGMEQALQLGEESHQNLSIKKNLDIDTDSPAGEKKNKKKKKKKNKQGNGTDAIVDQAVPNKKESTKEMEEKTEGKPIQVRTFPNGLVIEEVAMGKPDGKKASPGKKVSVHYIGKLKTGAIFDSNIGRAPFKFRLGIGQVIKGWDVGVNGMRVGDKRRLTIPPAMGYGAQGAGRAIPPNSWLVFDVELVDVN